jgi:5-formyltetrahydrofolate cyclo-ligase
MNGPMEKQAIREEVWRRIAQEGLHEDPYGRIPPFPGQNKAAERLRRTALYRGSLNVMVPPDRPQLQVRINLLQDRKRLIMATPGLRDGFYEIPGGQIPPSLWTKAVSSIGVIRYGKKLATTLDEIGRVDLMVTGAVAVSLEGDRIGKGTGYFDLEYMILREIGSVRGDTPIVAVIDDPQVFEELPWGEKDVSIDLIVTPTASIPIRHPHTRPRGIDWPSLQGRQIKRMRPLRELARSR